MKKNLYVKNNIFDEIAYFSNIISITSPINLNNTITMKYRSINYDI